ncbi:hypothetical protein O6H91_09G094900 [Diphasiastrum complanatum]|uniref:Uncharacterized protein n=1 Tax=Diphasiastrum complanatum TaxID=34168 RepID=A0ACC2CS80_DIPCM|nr:hypothetical protein O6H91_Y073700 [Diphasiastrum complanatum]KAJ7544822.1 hypothetical protein O6H91_09G094900 [Diphasiastrum complanatum]
MGVVKQRPAPLVINNKSRGITKAGRPLCSTMQHRLPIVIYTYSPKIIHTDARSFMSLVQRLTGSTPTRLRCAESTAASDTSHKSEDMSSGRILSCDVDDQFDLWTESDDLAIDQGLCSQVETDHETISCTCAMESLSLPACCTIKSGVDRGLTSPRISCLSDTSEMKKQGRNVEAEMSLHWRSDGQIDQSCSAVPNSTASRLCHVHNAGEDLLAYLPSLTPSTNDFLRDLPVIFAEKYEALGNLLSPGSNYSPQGSCLSSLLSSPGSVTCREMAFALLRDDGAEQYQILI